MSGSKAVIDDEARVDRLRRAGRYRAMQAELAAEEQESMRVAALSQRQRAAVREQAISEELERVKAEELRREKMVQLARARAPELRELEEKLRAAYTDKHQKIQIEEAALQRQRAAEEERAWGEEAVAQAQLAETINEERRMKHARQVQSQQEAIRQQIVDREAALEEARKQFMAERSAVDAIVARVQEEDFLEKLAKVNKQRVLQSQHDEFSRQRETVMQEEVDRQAQEEENIKKFLVEQSRRKESGERLRREKEAAKQKLLEEQSRTIATERARKEQLEELINELYVEQEAARQRAAAQAEQARRARDRELMLQANAAQLQHKQQREEQRLAEEQTFRANMMAKFAEDDRLEEQNKERRRLLKVEHARRVQELMEEKRRLEEIDRQREEQLQQQALAQEAEFQAIVAQERERLLREHAANLGDRLPKGVITSERDREIIAEAIRAGASSSSSATAAGATGGVTKGALSGSFAPGRAKGAMSATGGSTTTSLPPVAGGRGSARGGR